MRINKLITILLLLLSTVSCSNIRGEHRESTTERTLHIEFQDGTILDTTIVSDFELDFDSGCLNVYEHGSGITLSKSTLCCGVKRYTEKTNSKCGDECCGKH